MDTYTTLRVNCLIPRIYICYRQSSKLVIFRIDRSIYELTDALAIFKIDWVFLKMTQDFVNFRIDGWKYAGLS